MKFTVFISTPRVQGLPGEILRDLERQGFDPEQFQSVHKDAYTLEIRLVVEGREADLALAEEYWRKILRVRHILVVQHAEETPRQAAMSPAAEDDGPRQAMD